VARALLLALALPLAACRVDVLHGMPETQANSIVAVLQQHGIAAGKTVANPEANTWSVSVPKKATARAWAVLAEYKLPKDQERGFRDVFGKNALVTTPMEERALYIEALQGEIARTLEAVDGIIDARVHLVLPDRDLSGELLGTPKASVVIEYQTSNKGLVPIQTPEVQQMVSHAVDGLAPQSVSVVQKPASIAAPTVEQTRLDFVSVGPLVVESSSLPYLKAGVAIAMGALAALGGLLFWQGRAMGRLRDELEAVRTRANTLQRAAGR
jgi:type III secretion protein J